MWTKPNIYGIKECGTNKRGINLWETTFNLQA